MDFPEHRPKQSQFHRHRLPSHLPSRPAAKAATKIAATATATATGQWALWSMAYPMVAFPAGCHFVFYAGGCVANYDDISGRDPGG